MKGIHVLVRIYGINDSLLIYVLRKRELHKDSVNFGTRVKLGNTKKKLILGYVIRQSNFIRINANLFTCTLLISDVNKGRRIASDYDDRKPRNNPCFLLKPVYFLGKFKPYFCRD